MQMLAPAGPLKMRDLERLTGVNRETIRIYLRQGLLPEPRRPKANVAEYSEAHVRGVLAIRALQQQQRLSLPQIKRAMAGDFGGVAGDAGAFPRLDALVAARLGVDDALVPLVALLGRNPEAAADARALARIGAVRLRRRAGAVHLSPTDAQIVGLWGDMRAAGFTEAVGFTPAITRFYVEEAEALAEREVSEFLGVIGDHVAAEQAAAMAQSAVNLMLPFLGLLRTKAVLDAFARHGARHSPGRQRKPKAPSQNKKNQEDYL